MTKATVQYFPILHSRRSPFAPWNSRHCWYSYISWYC